MRFDESYFTDNARGLGEALAEGYPAVFGEPVVSISKSLTTLDEIKHLAIAAYHISIATCYFELNEFPGDYEERMFIYPDGMTADRARQLFVINFCAGFLEARKQRKRLLAGLPSAPTQVD